MVIRNAKINERGTISYKSEQISAYADGIDIVGRSQAFISFEKTAGEMQQNACQLQENDCRHSPSHIVTGLYKYDTVHTFT
jgi:hypothetical protein